MDLDEEEGEVRSGLLRAIRDYYFGERAREPTLGHMTSCGTMQGFSPESCSLDKG
jgi:hypothetical protein